MEEAREQTPVCWGQGAGFVDQQIGLTPPPWLALCLTHSRHSTGTCWLIELSQCQPRNTCFTPPVNEASAPSVVCHLASSVWRKS